MCYRCYNFSVSELDDEIAEHTIKPKVCSKNSDAYPHFTKPTICCAG